MLSTDVTKSVPCVIMSVKMHVKDPHQVVVRVGHRMFLRVCLRNWSRIYYFGKNGQFSKVAMDTIK